MKTIFRLLKNMIRLETPIPTIGTMLVSVNDKVCRNTRRKVPTGLTRSKSFIDRLQTAKQEQEELKIKSVNFSEAHLRAYIVVNLRKNSNHKAEIGKSPSCGCADFVKNSGKELCKPIIWTQLDICRPIPIVLVKCWKVALWNAKKLLKNCQKSKKLLPKFQKLLPKFLAIFI